MGLFRAPEKRGLFPEPIIPPFPGTDFGGGVSVRSKPDQALTVPAVWACVSLLAGSASSLPLETFRRTADTPARVASPQLVATPSEGQTQSEWVHMLLVSLLLRGNAYGRISQRDAMLRPKQIDLLNPDALDVRVDPDTNEIQYRIRKTQAILPNADVWHLRGVTMPGSKIGLSPISYAAATLGIDISSRKFANDFFDGGGIPKAVLTSDMKVDPEQARGLKERLMASFRNREPIVLGNGVSYQMISVRPEESQFLATLQANVAQVARFFGVPPEMVGGTGGNSMTYANVEQRSLDFLTYALAPWLKRIEDAISALLPQPQYVKFRTIELLRLDAHTSAQVDMYQIASKVITPTEVRDARGLPPMTEAQKAESNMVPLGIGPLGRPTGTPALKLNPGTPAPTPVNDQQGNPQGV